jgi:REP element-mobilizing transposase RayT
MAYPPRLQIEKGFYHIIQRGNARQRIFDDDRDHEAFLERLRDCARLLACRVHAYCLMGNHVHLLLETRKPTLSAFGQRLFASYTLWYNRKHRRTGHLLQGRFKSFLVDSDGYLAEVSRYIHLNPVRARMVEKPEAYRWSSLGAYVRRGGGVPWVRTREVLERFEGSRKAYLEYVYEGIDKPWKPEIVDRLFIGTDEFVRRVKRGLGWMDGSEAREQLGSDREEEVSRRILRTVAEACGVPRDKLTRKRARAGRVAEARQAAVLLLRRETPLTYRRIGELLGGVSAPGVAKAYRLAEPSPAVRATADRVAKALKLT